MKEDLAVLVDLDVDTQLQLIDSVYLYLLDNKSVPIKKMTIQIRVPFSAIYTFLRGNPQHRIKQLDSLSLDAKVKTALKSKIYLMYAQNFTQIGLLSSYKNELAKVTHKSHSSVAELDKPLSYVGCKWKINVVLSTNYVNKVLRPEVQLELYTREDVKIRMTVPVEKFEELRRQVAALLRQAQQIECVRYIN